jgi:hypothetical protein
LTALTNATSTNLSSTDAGTIYVEIRATANGRTVIAQTPSIIVQAG